MGDSGCMRDATRNALAVCPVEVTMSVIGGCWKLSIIQELLDHTLRYSELRRAVGTVTDRVLTRQLRELEADGLVDIELTVVWAAEHLAEGHRKVFRVKQGWQLARDPATGAPRIVRYRVGTLTPVEDAG